MRILLFLLFGLLSQVLFAQANDKKKSVQITTELDNNTPSIRLNWLVEAEAISHIIYRKSPGSSAWGSSIASLGSSDSTYLDTDIEIGTEYHYRVVRVANGNTGYGYIRSGIELSLQKQSSYIAVVVDTVSIPSSNFYVQQYINDLIREGWHTAILEVHQDSSVVFVKDKIQELYDDDDYNLSTVVLIGNVPVPYSGNIAPDGHANHEGAWAADVFYADMTGVWTDATVNNTVASGTRNDNVPGDGKYDQSSIPSDLEMEIGRIDLSSLPGFSESELELLEKYFIKNHKFRHKIYTPQYRGLIENNFNGFPEGFAQNGLKNFSAMFGSDSINYVDFDNLKTSNYIWAYGCGGGTFTSASGIGTTSSFAADSLQATFAMIFGSYFGDFDSPSNNFLKAALGTGNILTNAWGGRPNWYFYPMALGHTTGHCANLTQNNVSFQHEPGFGNRQIHIALMGDPSLRMYISPKASDLSVCESNGSIELTWSSPDTNILGFHVYKKEMPADTFMRLTADYQPAESYSDPRASCLEAGDTIIYMVRSVELVTSSSGSFYNLAPGILDTVTHENDCQIGVDLSYISSLSGDSITFTALPLGADSVFWSFGDGEIGEGLIVGHVYQETAEYEVGMNYFGNCVVNMKYKLVDINISTTNIYIDTPFAIYLASPIDGIITIDGNPSALSYEVKLLDSNDHVHLNLTGNWDKKHIYINDIPGGPYYLEISKNGNPLQRMKIDTEFD